MLLLFAKRFPFGFFFWGGGGEGRRHFYIDVLIGSEVWLEKLFILFKFLNFLSSKITLRTSLRNIL